MKRVILTKGLPACGKTTWAKELLLKEAGKWKRVNKDDLRAMLDDGKWSRGNEKFVLEVRDFLLTVALGEGFNVIVDDTNLATKHHTRIKQLVDQYNQTEGEKAEVEVKDFTDVDLEECIKRDQKRPNYVGEKIIRQMYNQFIRPALVKPEWVEGLPTAVICDLDGTLALFGDANPYDRDFTKDTLNRDIWDLLNRYRASRYTIILLSGRMDKFRAQTEEWLKSNLVSYDLLLMRKTDDLRKDFFIKEEIYNEHIKGKYNIAAVFDDRLQVCRLWYRLGLPLFKVGDPDSDF